MPPFEYANLSDDEKLRLCRALLEEFGVTHIQATSGGELIHSCPLPLGGHPRGDRRPSASLNYRKLTFNCLGCGNSGGLLWFIGICRGTTSTDARKWLGSKTGTDGTVQELADLLRFFDALYEEQEEQPIPRMDISVLNPWLAIHPWLTEIRKIPAETLMRFYVGYNPDAERIVIPHFWKGNLVGWQSRKIAKDTKGPKYISSPDFPKARTLYNYMENDRPHREAIVVESPMSVLSKFHVARNMVATFGATLAEEQLRLLQRHGRVTLFFDNDEAGWGATEVAAAALASYSDVWVATNPYAADAADFDDRAFITALTNGVPYSVWRRPGTLEPWQPEVTDDADQEARLGRGAA